MRPRKGRNIPDYDVIELEWEGRLLIACIRSNVEESLGKLLEGVILK